jgi:hypothetical protein
MLHEYMHIMTDLPHLMAESTFMFGEFLVGRYFYGKVVKHIHRDLFKRDRSHGHKE